MTKNPDGSIVMACSDLKMIGCDDGQYSFNLKIIYFPATTKSFLIKLNYLDGAKTIVDLFLDIVLFKIDYNMRACPCVFQNEHKFTDIAKGDEEN